MPRRNQASFNLPAIPTGDEDFYLPPPPRPQPVPTARPARARPRKKSSARTQFLAGLLGGAAFVLTPTLVLAGHLVH